MSSASRRPSGPRGAWLAGLLGLAGCLDLGGGPSFPLQERISASEGALTLARRDAEGGVAHARFDAAGSAVFEPGFAAPPWTEPELELVLAAALGGPLLRRGATLSADPSSSTDVLATDAQGRVLRVELDPTGAARSLELVLGFAPALPRRWTVARSSGALVLAAPDGGELRFELR